MNKFAFSAFTAMTVLAVTGAQATELQMTASDWQGLYGGVEIGDGFGNDKTIEKSTSTGVPDGFVQSFKTSGAIAGFHAG